MLKHTSISEFNGNGGLHAQWLCSDIHIYISLSCMFQLTEAIEPRMPALDLVSLHTTNQFASWLHRDVDMRGCRDV